MSARIAALIARLMPAIASLNCSTVCGSFVAIVSMPSQDGCAAARILAVVGRTFLQMLKRRGQVTDEELKDLLRRLSLHGRLALIRGRAGLL